MAKKIPFIMVAAGLIVALVISLASYSILKKKARAGVKVEETVNVAVAAVDMSWGTTLTVAAIKTAPYLKKSLPEGYHPGPERIVGRVLVYPVKANEPIFESSLAPDSIKKGGIAAVIQTKKRAMAVKVDKFVGVSGFVSPGNRVDVLATVRDSSDRRSVTTKTVLNNILVLATGPDVGTENKEKRAPVDVITLEVTPDEGERLALAAMEGKLQLALRNYSDTDKAETRGATIPNLLSGEPSGDAKPATRPAVSHRPAGSFHVEVIQGSSVSNQTFNGGYK